ncbi:MAG: T9SS type A sorting domain-containing protein [candidate division WOR-3 bacterium]|nr:T9SS type A sorting domain-containing protein [candidate division WOR-3 bacterium]
MKRLIALVFVSAVVCLGAHPRTEAAPLASRAPRLTSRAPGAEHRPSHAFTSPFTRFGRTADKLRTGRQHLKSVARGRTVEPAVRDLLEEFLLDTTRISGEAPGDQEFLDVAFDGTNYLAVWHEEVAGGISGARITRDGVLLDTFSIVISAPGILVQLYPSLSFDGANYFVVWMQVDTLTSTGFDIYGARITPAGIVLDPNGIPISTAEYNHELPAVGFDGVNYLVAWSDYRNGTDWDIYAARVTTAGQVLDPLGIPVGTAPGDQFIFRGISSDGTNYLLVWQDDRDCNGYYDVYGARVTRSGAVLDTTGIPVSVEPNNQGFARAAFDGANYLITWMDDRMMREDHRIYAARMTQEGVVLDTDGIRLTDYRSIYPDLVFDSTNYFVVWTDGRSGEEAGIYGARVTPTGVVIDSGGIQISTAESVQWPPAVSYDGARLLVTWADYRGESADPYGARVTIDGTVLDPNGILLAYGWTSPTQQSPAAAFDGTNYLAVWQDDRNETPDIYATRVTSQGVILDPQGILVGTGFQGQFSPAVAFDGTNFLVVWSAWSWTDCDIYGARVTPAGVVLDPYGIPIAASQYYETDPSLAFDGANYLVVWEHEDMENQKCDVYGARVTPQGAVLQELAIAADSSQFIPTVSFGAANYLVTWTDDRDGDNVMDVYGARVSPAGVVLEPSGIPISTFDMDQSNPVVAFDGTNWLVAWEDYRGDASAIYGARVGPGGVVFEPDGIPISPADMDQSNPAAAFDGTNWLVAWEDYRGDASAIYGARVTRAGAVLDPEGMELINGDQDRYEPGISQNCRLLTFSGDVPRYRTTKALAAFYSGAGIAEAPRSPIADPNLDVLPNPLQGVGFVEMALVKSGDVKLSLLDITGRRVRTLAAGSFLAGRHRIALDVRGLAAGVYLLELRTNRETLVQRAVLVK